MGAAAAALDQAKRAIAPVGVEAAIRLAASNRRKRTGVDPLELSLPRVGKSLRPGILGIPPDDGIGKPRSLVRAECLITWSRSAARVHQRLAAVSDVGFRRALWS